MLWPYIVGPVVKISLNANNKPPKVADSFGKTFVGASPLQQLPLGKCFTNFNESKPNNT